jgi:phosphoglycerol transferase MdoB-like AlkP superfamily enzyme
MKFLSIREYLKSSLWTVGIRLLFLVALYSFFRLLFYWANADLFPNSSLSVFLYGIPFDVSAIFYTNGLYILLALLPFSFSYTKIYRRIGDIYFIFANTVAALVSCGDIAYYPYVLKRTTADIFSYLYVVGSDFQTLIPSFVKQFWYLFLLFIGIILTIVFIVRYTNRRTKHSPDFDSVGWTNFSGNLFVFLVCMGLSVICMRGGLQLRPLSLIDTGKNASIQNAALVANTPFIILQTLGKQNDIEKHYFTDLEEAERYFSPALTHIVPYQDCFPVKNVLVIVLESFSQYLIEDRDTNTAGYQGYCPFIDSLLHRSLSFNGIANGRRTIEALPAIFGGIPTLLNMSYVESSFANNYCYSPIEIVKNSGYNTLFFHGAKNGSMNIESYCSSIGFEHYFGKNEYPTPSDDDGVWGISDRPYLKYVAHVLDTVRKPFFAGILTLSSHNPCILPKDAADLDIRTGAHPMLAVSCYTDHALREFFTIISQYDWFDSTLFVFTADHTGDGTVPLPDNRYMSYQIPIFFFHPLAPAVKSPKMIQQLDIMPSIFSYLNINKSFFSFGQNIFDSTYIPYAVNYLSGTYQLFTHDFVFQFDGEKTIGVYNIKTDIEMKHNLLAFQSDEIAVYEQRLKAIIQSYTTRMNRNQLFIDAK